MISCKRSRGVECSTLQTVLNKVLQPSLWKTMTILAFKPPSENASFLHAGLLWSGTLLCRETLWLAKTLKPQTAKSASARRRSAGRSVTGAPSRPGPTSCFWRRNCSLAASVGLPPMTSKSLRKNPFLSLCSFGAEGTGAPKGCLLNDETAFAWQIYYASYLKRQRVIEMMLAECEAFVVSDTSVRVPVVEPVRVVVQEVVVVISDGFILG